jgi:hypothetical protein
MARITLAKAFVLRKRITKEIDEIESKIRYAEVILREGEPNFNYNRMTLDSAVSRLITRRKALSTLNSAIDKANAESARPILNEIEIEKRNLKLFSFLAAKQKAYVPVKKVFDEHEYNPQTNQLGAMIEVKFLLDTEKDYTSLAKDTEKKIQDLEDNLSDINASVFVELTDEEYALIRD